MDPTYLQVDDGTLDDEKNQEVKVEELGVMDICGFMTMIPNIPNLNNDTIISKLGSSFSPMERTLFPL
jgi:hypothetical protein